MRGSGFASIAGGKVVDRIWSMAKNPERVGRRVSIRKVPPEGMALVECLCGDWFTYIPFQDVGKRTGPCSAKKCIALYTMTNNGELVV